MLKVKTLYETDNGTVVEIVTPEVPVEVALALHQSLLNAGRYSFVLAEGREGAREVIA